MMLRLIPALLALACSDYNLGTDEKGNARPDRPGDSAETSTGDTAPGESDGTSTDSGNTSGDTEDSAPPAGQFDFVFLLDVAYNYDCYHPDLQTKIPALIDAIEATGVDAAYAIATYDDYNVDGEWYSAWGGHPYTVLTQLTTDAARAKAVMAGVEMTWGGDAAGSAFEAVSQAMLGLGFDQACDGAFDTTRDIRPYIGSSGDAYGGAAGSARDSSTPGTGAIPGVGLREGSTRIVILSVDNVIRSRSYGHTMPSGACFDAASDRDAEDALRAQGAQILGVNVYEFWDEDPTPQTQLTSFVGRVGSKIDADGDGSKDDVAVLGGSWDWPATEVTMKAIGDLAGW